ncbi:MAG TPA: ABC transporter permease subunit [Candidatus Aminicenantes bacterium]|nr:ABC transporter permease subunit [Candidatus Aminicenantes bacterium]HRY65327.1 ABC transporter permease subunit [Candidatus Aminicenantes bacterium]HRZ72205.1 ABC transporter permease subunit [Candidatus Aminicenantes bacterium]
MAVIREKGYTHWDGRLVERRFPWSPITRTGILLAFRKKRFKLVFAATFVPAFVFLVGLYISERLEDFKAMIQGSDRLINIGPKYFVSYFTNDSLLFMIALVLALGAGGLIADDLRHGSLQLYFARPLGKKDYIAGKMSVAAFFVLLYTAVPGLLLVIFKLVFAGSFEFFLKYPWLPLSVLGASLLLTVFFAFYIMLLSSVSKNNRYVFVLVFGVYYFSEILFNILRGVFRTPYTALFSIPANIKQVGAAIFGQAPPLAVPAVWSFAVLAGFCGLAAVVLDRKIRSVEVIK